MEHSAQKPIPAGFPSDLADTALMVSNQVAWPPALAAASIEWFGAHGYAVLGTEVLLPQHGSVQSLPYFQSVDRKKDEAWDPFVARATAETLAYLRTISQKLVEEGDVYINVTWVSEADFRR